MHTVLTPSLPAQSFEELASLVQILAPHIPTFQVDLVDGDFVPLRSWPFTEVTDVKKELEKLAALTKVVPIEVDLMLMHPEEYLDLFVAVGVSSVIVHIGTTDAYAEIVAHARAHCYAIGIALTNDISTQELAPHVPHIDFVQVMGIRDVGTQGQPFDVRTLETLRTLRAVYPALPLVVDGSVNAETIPLLCAAGATRLAPGSAIAKAVDPVAAYKQLSALVAS